MKDCIALEAECFKLSLNFQVFESDISAPSNIILHVCVLSDDFSASTAMDIDIKDVAFFYVNLKTLYDSLSGEAKLQEPFGNGQYISFFGDRNGHILISGTLNSNGMKGFWQELRFENIIDQTYLLPFIKKLDDFLKLYIQYL